MKYLGMYAAFIYIIGCADHTGDGTHNFGTRLLRALFWPVTLTGWFVSQNGRMHRVLNILWIFLISGWLLSLLSDRL